MQGHRFFERFIQNQGVTPWQGEENNFHTIKTGKFREISLQPSEKKFRSLSPKPKHHDYSLNNRLLSRREPLAKIDKKILARTQTIHFQLISNQTNNKLRQMQKCIQNKTPRFFKNNSSAKKNQCSKMRLHKLCERKNRSSSSELYKSKYNAEFDKIKIIKSKELILSTNKNFFQSFQNRKSEKHSNRVSQMLSIIRRVMHKEGAIGKLIKKRQKSRLITDKERSNIINN